jgi:hypothetical protein
MGKNGGNASWTARLEKYGYEALSKRFSDMNKEHDNWYNKARQDEAEEKRKTLDILAKSGEPFWVRVKKDDIRVNKGDAMHRTYQGKTKCNFPKIQVCHGQYESVDNLHYLKCPFGNNIVVDLALKRLWGAYSNKGKGYIVKVPFGMSTASTKNGNALLAWFEKKC